MVGHNPGFTDLCNLLTAEAIANLPTCATATVTFDLPSWGQVAPDTRIVLVRNRIIVRNSDGQWLGVAAPPPKAAK